MQLLSFLIEIYKYLLVDSFSNPPYYSVFFLILSILSVIFIALFFKEKKKKYLLLPIFTLFSPLLFYVVIITFNFLFGHFDPEPSLHQTCLTAPGSQGCQSCKDFSEGDTGYALCNLCENEYVQVAGGEISLDEVAKECQDPN